MNQAFKKLTAVVVLVGSTAFITGHVVSQDHKGHDHDGEAHGQTSMQDEMAMWLKLAEPGKEHKELARFAGKWEQESIHYTPGEEPSATRMYADYTPILGGRFMMEKVNGRMKMGDFETDFEGLGIFGYDNLQQKHFFVWLDNFGTMMMTAYGDANEAGDVITYMSSMAMPGGEEMKFKSVSTIINDNKTTFEMYTITPEGEFKNMQITSTRK